VERDELADQLVGTWRDSFWNEFLVRVDLSILKLMNLL
jgi:hypothetical protein